MRGFRTFVLSNALRSFADVLTLVGVLVYMVIEGAPTWALILAVYVGTRTGRLDAASDKLGIQTTTKAVDENVDRVYAQLSQWIGEERQRQANSGGDGYPFPFAPTPPPTRTKGRPKKDEDGSES